MASWDRYGEDKKYRKDVDMNDNPKQLGFVGRRRSSCATHCFAVPFGSSVAHFCQPRHVGEPLRKLTLEDRLELRRQTREQQKKRSVLAEIDAADDSDGLDDSRPVKRTKSSGEGSGAKAASRGCMTCMNPLQVETLLDSPVPRGAVAGPGHRQRGHQREDQR